MTAPWIEIAEYQDQDVPNGPGFSAYAWQALFACQVEVLPHPEWVKLKWGFNASALFDEALERIQNEGIEPPDHCTLAFRFIHRPGEGLSVAVIGKIQARTRAEAIERSQLYYSELKSTIPYDYALVPARSRQEFLYMSGMDIFEETNHPLDLAQIKRVEIPSAVERGSPFLHGLWRSGPHAHEQIWRSLAGFPFPVLLNITVRATFLYEKERERLLKHMEEVSDHPKTGPRLKTWNKEYIERRLTLWKKLFYLQVHVVSPRNVGEHLHRIVGTALTLSGDGQAHPGYRVICANDEGQSWHRKLRNLDLIFTGSPLPVPRLSEVADLEEVFAVMRLPYSPPENGFPDMKFFSTRDQ
jgi:hypothetical protein